jgi:List-Bact-rpt repeat protein
MGTRRLPRLHRSTGSVIARAISGRRLPIRLLWGAGPVSLSFLAILILGPGMASAALSGSGSYPPPSSGAFAYNNFVPPLTVGASYVDPVFGETVKRLTTDHGRNDLYARNMWWNADETRYLHRTGGVAGKADRWDVIDVATGVVTHTGIPFGTFAADGGFDPADPNALYYLVSDRGDGRGEIRQITLKSGGTWTETVYFTAPARIADLGGTLNWLDASGRYMLVRYGAEPSIHAYDRQNLGAGPYANPIDATNSIERGGYMGLTPDGRFVVGYDDRPVGFGGMGQGVSWKIDHTNRTIAAAPTIFWSLCGDHGSFLSASDGRNYMIVNDCYSQPGLWRVDITNNADGLNENQQLALPNNARILGFTTWNDFGHVSTVARGAFRDWVFLASEDVKDTFNSGTADAYGNITPWHPYRQEIIAINVITGEIRRLAHHRSRSVATDYYSFPRVSTSWGGAVVGFASNFNQPGSGTPIVDVYAIRFAQSAPVMLSVARGGVGAGTVTSAPAGINCGSNCSAPFATGAVVALTATPATGSAFAGWSGPCSGTGTCTVTLNAATTVTATFNASTTFSLTVTKAGTGSGTVTSSPTGINCGATCSASFANGTTVTLTATPTAGSVFAGWSGACSGSGSCTVAANVDTAVTATFNISTTTVPLSVTKTGTLASLGSVTSSPSGINCGPICSANYSSGTTVTLTASTSSYFAAFAGWSGACSGTGSCTVTMNAATTVTATFVFSTGGTNALTVTKTGTGSGTVTSSPAGINCGATCVASYSSGTTVTLTATPAPGSTFAGWSGPCSGAATCTVTLNAAATVTAAFNTSGVTLALSVTKLGNGTVSSSPTGMSCGSTCSANFTGGSVITLTATPAVGSIFIGWFGACSGTGPCAVTMTAAQTVIAVFRSLGF